MRPRLLATAALFGVLMVCAVGCQAITGREPTCEQTPELCMRVAELAKQLLREMNAPTVTGTVVSPRVCDANEVGDTRCWWVDVTYQVGENRVGVHQHADGSLGIHHIGNGAPPDT